MIDEGWSVNIAELTSQYIELTRTQYWEFVTWIYKDQANNEEHEEELE